MKTVQLISTHPGMGLTTVAINLGTALSRLNKKILIGSQIENPKLNMWLRNSVPDEQQPTRKGSRELKDLIYSSHLGIDLLNPEGLTDLDSEPDFIALLQSGEYDYYLAVCNEECVSNHLPHDQIFVCTDLSNNQVEDLMQLDQELKNNHKHIDLVIPVRLDPKEWENNSSKLLALGEYFGYEKIADMIPACERIHDLAKDGQSIWDIQQIVLQNAFRQLLDYIL